jgi:hypothetical protein|tara:strand:- start:2708 stop:2971 length:264 start_codon:yes stop_codon:yes gene_type:complete
MTDTIYLKCSAKKRTFPNGGSILNLGVKADDLRAFIDAHTNKRGYVQITIKERKETGPYGDTHYVVLDTWEPTPKATPPDVSSDIPF